MSDTWVWFDKSKKSWKMGRSGSPFGLEDKASWTSWMLEDLQTLHIPTNNKLEVWTQYRLLLSLLGGYFSSFKKIWGKGRFVQNPKIRKNPEKSQACKISNFFPKALIFSFINSKAKFLSVYLLIVNQIYWFNYTHFKMCNIIIEKVLRCI